jgi:hypothetical protein
MPTKNFLPGLPGFRGCGLTLMLNRASRLAPQKQKTDQDSGVHHVVAKLRIDRYREHAEPPDVRQQAGRDAKRNHIGQRVEFLAKVTGGVGHARDEAIHAVQQRRQSDRQRRVVEVGRIGDRPLHALRNGIVAGRDIRRRKQRRQQVHAAAGPPLWANTIEVGAG